MQSFSYSLCGIAFNAFDVSSPYSANQMEWKNSTQWSKRTVSNGHLILCNTEHVHKIHKSDIVYLPKISQVALSVAAFLLKPIKTANLNPIEEFSLSPSVSSTRCSIILGCFYFHGVRVLWATISQMTLWNLLWNTMRSKAQRVRALLKVCLTLGLLVAPEVEAAGQVEAGCRAFSNLWTILKRSSLRPYLWWPASSATGLSL